MKCDQELNQTTKPKTFPKSELATKKIINPASNQRIGACGNNFLWFTTPLSILNAFNFAKAKKKSRSGMKPTIAPINESSLIWLAVKLYCKELVRTFAVKYPAAMCPGGNIGLSFDDLF